MKSSISKTIPDISVIVCHHKGDFLDKFIPSVKASIEVTYEIIVMTSDDALAEKGIPGCLVFHSTAMPAAKRNAGARIARAPILGFFDDDVEISPACLAHLIGSFFRGSGNQNQGMVYGKLHNAERRNRFDEAGGFLTSTGFIWSRAGQNEIDNGQYDKTETILAGKSALCAISNKIFTLVGGFDETFEILGEETDLSWRVWLAGYDVYYNPLATGVHYFNTKWKPASEYYTSKRVQFNGCRNYLAMLTKNLGKEHLWIIPLHIMIWSFAGLAMIGTLKIRQGLNIWGGIGHYILNLSKTLKKRKIIQETREINERDLWPKIYRKTPRGYYLQRFTRYLRIGLHG